MNAPHLLLLVMFIHFYRCCTANFSFRLIKYQFEDAVEDMSIHEKELSVKDNEVLAEPVAVAVHTPKPTLLNGPAGAGIDVIPRQTPDCPIEGELALRNILLGLQICVDTF